MRRLVDARGSYCPGPLTELIKTYRNAELGDEIELLATDPAAKSDVSAWAKKSGNELVELKDEQGYFKIVVKVVRKGR
ncbi:MAG: sulfurtransferase TusA family protein [Thaumarchaeota archaeon]|nr:sulfurtransferase TusA family protein [Candidatus Calditenuaceae archaeon]MDW8187250.1 sulfurtransferase TusA family protein [Nitrososphaerota archaeon]